MNTQSQITRIFKKKCRYYFLNSRLVKYDELKVAIITSNSCIYIFKKNPLFREKRNKHCGYNVRNRGI